VPLNSCGCSEAALTPLSSLSGPSGKNLVIGRVAGEDRKTHFQSLLMAPTGIVEFNWMLLNSVARLI
jgi:hypothetical protein